MAEDSVEECTMDMISITDENSTVVMDDEKTEDFHFNYLNKRFLCNDNNCDATIETKYKKNYLWPGRLNDEEKSTISLQTCRLCGLEGKYFTKISSTYNLIYKIEKYIPFINTQQSNVSDYICFQCFSTVNTWHGFYANCLIVNRKTEQISSFKNWQIDSSQSEFTSNNNYNSSNTVLNIIKTLENLNYNSEPKNILQIMNILTENLKSLLEKMIDSVSFEEYKSKLDRQYIKKLKNSISIYKLPESISIDSDDNYIDEGMEFDNWSQ